MSLRLYLLLILSTIVLNDISLDGHGFGADTYVRIMPDGWCRIQQVCESIADEIQSVLSYETGAAHYVGQKVTSSGMSTTDCYIEIYVKDRSTPDITCTPTQPFYNPQIRAWIEAYQLRAGDPLLSADGTWKYISEIKCVKMMRKHQVSQQKKMVIFLQKIGMVKK